MWNEIFDGIGEKVLLTKATPIALLNLSIILLFLSTIWHSIKTACSDLKPVPSKRSKSTRCPRKGCLPRFELNSTAISVGSAQKLGNDVCHDSESIATKVCSQNQWQMKLAICLCKESSTVSLTSHHSSMISLDLEDQSYISSSQFSLFQGRWATRWAMSKIVPSENISNAIYVECEEMYGSKVWAQEFWYFVPGFDIQPEPSKNDNPARNKAVAVCETLQVIYRFFRQIETNP